FRAQESDVGHLVTGVPIDAASVEKLLWKDVVVFDLLIFGERVAANLDAFEPIRSVTTNGHEISKWKERTIHSRAFEVLRGDLRLASKIADDQIMKAGNVFAVRAQRCQILVECRLQRPRVALEGGWQKEPSAKFSLVFDR